MGNDRDYRKQVGINYHPMTYKLWASRLNEDSKLFPYYKSMKV